MAHRSYRDSNLSPIWALILLNILVAIATLINRDLIFLFGVSPATFIDRPWTIVTSMFVHSGFWHLIVNMITLYFFGAYLIELVGKGKFLTVYFGGGILGSILFILLAPHYSIGVGASGAIFALGGALAMMRPKAPVLVFPIPAPIPLALAVIGSFVILSFLPSVAWQAHLGGIVFGLIAGYFFRKQERRHFF